MIKLNFPLDHKASWIYKGRTEYRIIGAAEKTPAMKFILTSRPLSEKTPSPYNLSLTEEGEPLETLQLMKTQKGIISPLTGNLWFPKQVKMGDSWSVQYQGGKILFILSNLTKITVPAGTFPVYLIDFKGPQYAHGSFYLDPLIGVISFEWSARSSSGTAETNLKLVSYKLH